MHPTLVFALLGAVLVHSAPQPIGPTPHFLTPRVATKDWNAPRPATSSSFLRKRDLGRSPEEWEARRNTTVPAGHDADEASFRAFVAEKRAQAGRWENMEGSVKGHACPTSWGGSHLAVYYQTKENKCKVKSWGGDKWGGWEDLGGYLDSPPSVCSYDYGHSSCYVKGDDDYLWHKSYQDSKWNSWENLGGDMKYEPASCSWGQQHMAVYATSKNDECYYKKYEKGSWYSWENLGGYLYGPPKVVTYGYGYMYLMVRGDDNQMWTKHYKNGAWGKWQAHGGYLAGYVSAYVWKGYVHCYVKGQDGDVWGKQYDQKEDRWGDWYSLGGGGQNKWEPDVVAYDDKVEVYSTWNDNTLYRKTYENDRWSDDWEKMGGKVDSKPSPVCWDDCKKVDIYMTGTGGECQRCY